MRYTIQAIRLLSPTANLNCDSWVANTFAWIEANIFRQILTD